MIITKVLCKNVLSYQVCFYALNTEWNKIELQMQNFLQGSKTLDSTGINGRLLICNSNNQIQFSHCCRKNVPIWPFCLGCILSSWTDLVLACRWLVGKKWYRFSLLFQFVAHPNCQQHLTASWYGKEMGFLQTLPISKKLLFSTVALPFLPFLCIAYIVDPKAKVCMANNPQNWVHTLGT